MSPRLLISSLVTLSLAAALAALAACSDSTATSGSAISGVAHVRVINAIFQEHDPVTFTGVPIDFLVDSSASAPGALNIASGGMTAGDSANGYSSTSAAVHSFVARRAGDTGPLSSFYTTTTNLPYLPKQALTTHTFYTIVVTGVLPNADTIPQGTVNFTALVDDPFPGPTVEGVTQARFRVINAAPFTTTDGSGTYLRMYLTPGAMPPANLLASYSPLGIFMAYGCSFGCNQYNASPGTYTLTVADQFSNTVFGQTQVTFAAGDVYTFVVQSTGYSDTPGTGNTTIRTIHDHSAP